MRKFALIALLIPLAGCATTGKVAHSICDNGAAIIAAAETTIMTHPDDPKAIAAATFSISTIESMCPFLRD
jgi:hypothetical protein